MADDFTRKSILCLDFDGVIHSYTSGWQGPRVVSDPPVPGIGAYLLNSVCHFNVVISSSRSRQWGGRPAMRRHVREILWDACLADTQAMEQAWACTQGKPVGWIPWTAYDVRDVADHIHSKISYPLFKPSASWSIDDRALTFNGRWDSPEYQPNALKVFRPWNKR